MAHFKQQPTRKSSIQKVEYASKKEILDGIDKGLHEMNARKQAGKRVKTLEELIKEL